MNFNCDITIVIYLHGNFCKIKQLIDKYYYIWLQIDIISYIHALHWMYIFIIHVECLKNDGQ